MPLPNPTSLWKLARVLIRVSGEVIPPALAWMEAQPTDSADVEDPSWVRAVVRFSRGSPAGTSEDFAQFKLDLVNITGGAIDDSWTAGDLTDVIAHITALCTTLAPELQSSTKADEIRFYKMAFNSVPDITRPFADTGPPFHVADINVQGTGAGTEPYQIATSVTFRTAWAKHWGRVYWPSPWHAAGLTETYGRLVPAHRTAVANAFEQMISDLAGHDFLTVVPVGAVGKQPYHALLGIDEVVVDDIPDVQRRRRPRTVGARTLGTHT